MAKKTKALEYERLGREAQDLIVNAYGEIYNLRRQMWFSFVKGVFAGLGGVIGATLMVGILGYLLYSGRDLPFIGHVFKNISESIKSYNAH